MKFLFSPSMKKVIGIAVLLFILELNMIALYTYTMVDHNNLAGDQRPKESIVRVKRFVNVVTGLLPGNEHQDIIGDNGSGDNNINTPVSDKLKSKLPNKLPSKLPSKQLHRKDQKKGGGKIDNKKPRHNKTTPTPSRPKARPTNKDRPFPKPPAIKLNRHPPTVVIAGAKCGGVVSLTQFMSLHPQIKLTTNVYSNITTRRNGTHNTKPKKGQVLIDVSPELLTTSQTAMTVKRFVPNLKLILMLRDPFDRALSCYHETVSRIAEGSGVRSFEDLVLTSKGRVNAKSELVTSSLYDVHLTKWLKTYNITHWLFMDYYQLSTQPYNSLRRLEKFLGVQPFFRHDDFTYNKQQLVCLSQKVSKKLKLTNQLCLQSNSTVSEVSLGADTEDQLRDYFTPHMEKLLSLVSSQIHLGDLGSLMN